MRKNHSKVPLSACYLAAIAPNTQIPRLVHCTISVVEPMPKKLEKWELKWLLVSLSEKLHK